MTGQAVGIGAGNQPAAPRAVATPGAAATRRAAVTPRAAGDTEGWRRREKAAGAVGRPPAKTAAQLLRAKPRLLLSARDGSRLQGKRLCGSSLRIDIIPLPLRPSNNLIVQLYVGSTAQGITGIPLRRGIIVGAN